jgi:SpoVK/Ycf46/Vps4 family AAA+-type ATPase
MRYRQHLADRGPGKLAMCSVFAEAQAVNSILFFDEAAALFGKRSEVTDSHDRYADIEINYLVQKIEAYAGVPILATNAREKIDAELLKRLHCIVDLSLQTKD